MGSQERPATARTHVVLPRALVAEIDALVGKRKRSEFIADVLEAQIRRRRLLAAIRALPDAPDLDVPGWETLESTTGWVDDLRTAKSSRERWLEENWYGSRAPKPPK